MESPITKITLPDAVADCIISNCVVNLVLEEEKQLVFHETFRLLKPGGRIAISDILLTRDLPNELKSDMALYVGCIAGASRLEAYERYLKKAGFEGIIIAADSIQLGPCSLTVLVCTGVLIIADHSDLNVYKTAENGSTQGGCCGPTPSNRVSHQRGQDVMDVDHRLRDLDFNEWAGEYLSIIMHPVRMIITLLVGSFKVYAIKPRTLD